MVQTFPAYNLTLEEYVERNKNLTPIEKLEIILKLLKEVKKLHDAGYIHGDLKPQNIMLNQDQDLKLIDFDLGGKIGDNGYLLTAPNYTYPQKLTPSKSFKDVFIVKRKAMADIYSIACIWLEFFYGKSKENDVQSHEFLSNTYKQYSGSDLSSEDKKQKFFNHFLKLKYPQYKEEDLFCQFQSPVKEALVELLKTMIELDGSLSCDTAIEKLNENINIAKEAESKFLASLPSEAETLHLENLPKINICIEPEQENSSSNLELAAKFSKRNAFKMCAIGIALIGLSVYLASTGVGLTAAVPLIIFAIKLLAMNLSFVAGISITFFGAAVLTQHVMQPMSETTGTLRFKSLHN